MDVKAINGLSASSFQGRTQHPKKEKQIQKSDNNYNSQPMYNSSKAMRNLVLGLMALGATAGTITSCDDDATASASASASASSSSSSTVIGGHCHHHDTVTIIKPDTIHDTDTIIHTEIKPIYVKDYPFHIGDSLIAQGENIGIPVDGPGSDDDNAVYIGSKAHNRYDNKFYESMVDSIGTNKRELAVVTKVVDMYEDDNPKTYYQKAVITDVPGRGIKITRYIADTDKKPDEHQEYLWNYAGYEVRTNGRDGKQNIRSIFDNNDNLVYRGNYEKGLKPGTFLYGSIILDPDTGSPVYDENGEPEFAQYDFDQAVIYSDYAKKSFDYEHPGWNYQ